MGIEIFGEKMSPSLGGFCKGRKDGLMEVFI